MSAYTTVKCDECGNLKAEANKWWRVLRLPHGYSVFSAEAANLRETFIDICSESCLQKAEGKERERLLSGERTEA